MKYICERGKACHCAHHTPKQRLFYEFANLPWGRRWQIAQEFGFCDGDPFNDDGEMLGEALLHIQNAGKLPELWNTLHRETGEFRGQNPLF